MVKVLSHFSDEQLQEELLSRQIANHNDEEVHNFFSSEQLPGDYRHPSFWVRICAIKGLRAIKEDVMNASTPAPKRTRATKAEMAAKAAAPAAGVTANEKVAPPHPADHHNKNDKKEPVAAK